MDYCNLRWTGWRLIDPNDKLDNNNKQTFRNIDFKQKQHI